MGESEVAGGSSMRVTEDGPAVGTMGIAYGDSVEKAWLLTRMQHRSEGMENWRLAVSKSGKISL